MNKEMIIAVCERLEKVPGIRWVDADMGQLASRDERPPVAFPCALVDMAYTSCDTLSGGSQKIAVEIRVRVGFDWTPPTNTGVPQHLREKAFGYLDTLEEIHKTLQWWNGDGRFNPMRRTRCTAESRGDKRKSYVITYITEFID